jgi:hypothetical protein
MFENYKKSSPGIHRRLSQCELGLGEKPGEETGEAL